MDVSFEIDENAIDKAKNQLKNVKGGLNKVLMRTINRALSTIKTQTAKAITQSYTVKSSDVKQSFVLKKAKKDDLSAQLISRGPQIPAHHFKIRPKTDTTGANRRAVKVEFKKGNSYTMPQGFMWNGRLYRRAGKERLPVTNPLGPSVPQMMSNEDMIESIQEKATETFNTRIEHETQALLEGKTK